MTEEEPHAKPQRRKGTEEEMVFSLGFGRVVNHSLIPGRLESILTVSNRPYLCVFAPLRDFFFCNPCVRVFV
jgi:hypothetical protein